MMLRLRSVARQSPQSSLRMRAAGKSQTQLLQQSLPQRSSLSTLSTVSMSTGCSPRKGRQAPRLSTTSTTHITTPFKLTPVMIRPSPLLPTASSSSWMLRHASSKAPSSSSTSSSTEPSPTTPSSSHINMTHNFEEYDTTDDLPKKKAVQKPWIWDLGLPTLLPEWRRMLSPKTIPTDIAAGLTVGCIAVPLSLAIALASGVPPEVGLVTAAVSGVCGGLFGGTTLAVTGPAAAISLLVAGAVADHGLAALPLITLTCGGLQVVSGMTRLGTAAKLVPVSVIAGFTTGVGMMILSGQVPKALGLVVTGGAMNPLETMAFCVEHLSAINPSSAALAVGTSAALYALPKYVHPKMPSALVAVGGATVATHMLGLDVTLIGTIPSGLEAFQFGLPELPPMEALPSLTATTFLIYAMTSAESLLSCVALEKMKKTPYKHHSDQELMGQGLANMGSALFMGMPVTSVIARSSLNVRLNAETRLPALVQSAFVFSSVVFFSGTIAMIPMPALSGMLISTGMGMLNPHELKQCYAIQKMDLLPFGATVTGMLAFGLAEGIGIGCLSAWAWNYDYGKLETKAIVLPTRGVNEKDSNSVSDTTGTISTTVSASATHINNINNPKEEAMHDTTNTTAWQLQGPINFIGMFEIDRLMHELKNREALGQDKIVLDMQEATEIELTGVEELVHCLLEEAETHNLSIEMWNCHEGLIDALAKVDPDHQILRYNPAVSSQMAPFRFPPKKEEPTYEKVPLWYDSPNFRP